jgi:hypothetical protein
MVFMQLVAISSICAGMMIPTCVDSNHCPRGQFCYVRTGQLSGRCFMCGETAPLVPYFETTDEETGYGPTGHEVIWNRCRYDSYPKDRLFGNYRSDTPDRFAGFNDSHVEAVCTRPFTTVPKYSVVMEGSEGEEVVKSFLEATCRLVSHLLTNGTRSSATNTQQCQSLRGATRAFMHSHGTCRIGTSMECFGPT